MPPLVDSDDGRDVQARIGRSVGLGLALVTTALVALGGYWWFAYGTGDDVEPATAASPAALVGTWRLQDGSGSIDLTAGGRFRAGGLPDEVFHYASDSTFTGDGRWSLADGGRSLALRTSDLATPMDWAGGPELSVVSDGHGLQLCVNSAAPGVLCDYVLDREQR